MENYLITLLDKLVPAGNGTIYLILFISAVIENIFPPIPGDTITAFGAFLVGTGKLNFFLVYLSTTLGSVTGFILLFFAGRYLGKEFFTDKNYRYLSAQKIHSAENWFTRYGYYIVLLNRFLPGVRSAIAIVSGISRLSPFLVAILSLLSASVWNLIWIQAGYTLGSNWTLVRERLSLIIKNYNLAAGLVIIVVILSLVIHRLIKKRKS